MKKKKKPIEEVLARAEKMFARGNFSLAKKEFEKAQKKLKREDIAEKIWICRKEAETLKGRELIKRARKAEKKGDFTRALQCFEAASSICNEEWIIKRIGVLRDHAATANSHSAAKEAQAAGDFQKAADLYATVGTSAVTTDLLLQRAECLVRAENYAQAVAVFENLSLTESCSRYDYGLALAKIERHGECLHVWQELETVDEKFAEQKKTVCLFLAADLYDRFAEKGDYAAIYRDTRLLLNSAGDCLARHQIRSIEDLLECAKYAWIEELWDAEEFETIAGLLEGGSAPMTPTLLALHAKIWFKLAINDGKHLTTMLLYWITAIYSRQITVGFSTKGDETQKVRQKLIDLARDLIKKYGDTEYGRRAATYLKIDQTLIQELINLTGEKQDRTLRVCTPLYAARFGITADILSLIRENKAFFKETENYLETGAYYSAAGKCLYLMENHEFEKAINLLADLPKKNEDCEFMDYAEKRLHFEFGMYCLEKGEGRLNGFFKAAPALFDLAPVYEQKFTEKALGIDEWDTLQLWEDALSYINEKRPSEAVRQALSLVMCRRAMTMCNQGKLSMKAMNMISKKALQLYPENEMARCTLRDITINFEVKEIYNAFNRHKLGRASQIALESEHPQVRDKYFEFVADIFEEIMKSELDHNDQLIMLNDLYEWAVSVDADQPVLGEIYSHLNMEETG
jgi:tetratricopeptide (TPR) repeat protein